ncbi:MAG: hypothetical protein FWG78_00815 [Coriobacteriia bacterium]|nr:hypothetical protein [Coriobacteriia bacterium]
MENQYEQTRRVQTVAVSANWTSAMSPALYFAFRIVSQLDDKQCDNLYRLVSFDVQNLDPGLKPYLCELCMAEKHQNECSEECSASETYAHISGKALSELRTVAIRFLNEAETVMTARALGIVDKDTIDRQFMFLVDPRKGQPALEKFRKVSGGYPNLDAFIEELKEANNASYKSPLTVE